MATGGSLELSFVTIANRTQYAACTNFDVPCCATAEADPCLPSETLGGAAVSVTAGGLFTATRVLFRDLRVGADGGAILSFGIVRVKQSWFLDCTAGRWGGAMALLEGNNAALINTVEDCTVARCVSETGGAINVGVPNFRHVPLSIRATA